MLLARATIFLLEYVQSVGTMQNLYCLGMYSVEIQNLIIGFIAQPYAVTNVIPNWEKRAVARILWLEVTLSEPRKNGNIRPWCLLPWSEKKCSFYRYMGRKKKWHLSLARHGNAINAFPASLSLTLSTRLSVESLYQLALLHRCRFTFQERRDFLLRTVP